MSASTPSQSNPEQVPAQAQAQVQPKPPTAQEILQSLERDYQERNRELIATRESLSKSQEQVIAAQEATHKAFQLLSVNKERYLVNIIAQHQSQTQSLTQELSKLKQLYTSLIQQVNAPKSASAVVQVLQEQASEQASEQVQAPQVPAREDNVSV